MPRLVFEEPKGGPASTESAGRRRGARRDNVVVVLKAATFALVVALVAAGILLTTTAGGEEPAARVPAVPEIEASGAPDPTTTLPPARIVAPEVRTQTAVITPPPPPVTTTRPPAPPPGDVRPPERDDRLAAVGRRCDTPGEYAFTERYEPVVCVARRGGKPVWRPVFE